MAKRTPVTATGVALLAMIAASTTPSEGVLMLTQDEGKEAVDAGYAVVDTSVVEGNTAAVSLTDAGRAALTSNEGTAGGAAAISGYQIDAAVPMPGNPTRRGRSGGYPFEALQVGQSFHVSKPNDVKTLDELLTRLSSSVSGARTRFAEKTGEMETVTVKAYKRGEDGKFLKTPEGKRVIDTETPTEREKLKVTRDFYAAKVGADDPKGEGVRIWRTV